MDNNIIVQYINFVKKQMSQFYKLVLGTQYDKKLVETLLEQYLLVRYYDETNYPKERDFVERIGRELYDLIEPLMNKKNAEQIKNIYSLFGYIPYFDDCFFLEDEKELLEIFFQDENLKIEFTPEKKKEIRSFLRNFRLLKEKFHALFTTKNFYLKEKRIKKNLYRLTLGHDVKISNLFSDFAIEKVFNTGIINEDKLFVQFIMASEIILENAISLDFSRSYVMDLPSSFFAKEKKLERVFHLIDNTLAKKQLILNINYEDYLVHKNKIEDFIKEGYTLSLTINKTFDDNISNFILFSHIFIYNDSEFYDIIIENKDSILSQLIVL